jgi:hypothetical protein
MPGHMTHHPGNTVERINPAARILVVQILHAMDEFRAGENQLVNQRMMHTASYSFIA